MKYIQWEVSNKLFIWNVWQKLTTNQLNMCGRYIWWNMTHLMYGARIFPNSLNTCLQMISCQNRWWLLCCMPQCGVVGGCPFFDAPCFFHPRPVTPFFPPSCDTIMSFSYKGKDVTQWCLFHTNDNGHKVGMPKMQETKVCHLKTSGETNTTCQTPVCQEKKAWSDCEPMFQCVHFSRHVHAFLLFGFWVRCWRWRRRIERRAYPNVKYVGYMFYYMTPLPYICSFYMMSLSRNMTSSLKVPWCWAIVEL